MISLTIDDRPITVAAGTTIWEAARQLGITIPTLCHQPRLRPVGVCRLCVVDAGGRTLTASCVRACEPGMRVETQSRKVEDARYWLLAMLMSDHPSPCERQRTTGDCELEALALRYRVPHPVGWVERSATHPVPRVDTVLQSKDTIQPARSALRPVDSVQLVGSAALHPPYQTLDLSSRVIAVDHDACILCDRCIRACDEIQCNDVIGRTGKGFDTRIGFDLDLPMGQSTCVSCGECAASCPTGALTHKPLSLPLLPRADMTSTESVCPYCGVGCATTYFTRDNKIVLAEGRDGPGSQGRLCVKGRYGWDYAQHPQRLTMPLIRRPEHYPKGPLSSDVRGERHSGSIFDDDSSIRAAFREATWDEALDLTATRLLAIKRDHGPQALAGFGSAKCSNEEAYLFQKLVRAAFGTNNVDHCTRLCHASSVAALMEGIGSGAVTDTYGDVAHADVVLLTGTNTTSNHPVAATFFKQAARQGKTLIVVDPRHSPIADFAAHYCAIKPGTDVAFYNALMHVLFAEDLVDHAFIAERTENVEALRTLVGAYSPERVAPVCGIDAARLRTIARTIGRAKNFMIFWGMGISQHTHGTDNARCLIALCLLTGHVGRPGTGLHPLRGQNNVQGASDAGLIPMVYPDYQSVENEAVRRRFEAAWGVPLDPKRGLTVVEIMKAARDGRIKGMLMMGENPSLSDPNINKVRQALANLEFLAVQDIFLTETAEFADVILPATSFFEKTGTYTNTDRRVQIGRQVIEPPGQARLDWQVICELATRMGHPLRYDGPEAIFAEMASLTTSYRGLDYAALGHAGKLWPIESAGAVETPVLFGERFPTPSGKARFVPAEFAPPAELPDDEYPFVLNTGRVLEHWHTGTMTRRAAVLDALVPAPFVEVHPDDLARLGLADGAPVTLRSRRGVISLAAVASTDVTPGSVFIPFHFREAAANVLTIDQLDPFGKIPEFKFCAVRLEGAP
jgi:formate dehydrogenase major subunit